MEALNSCGGSKKKAAAALGTTRKDSLPKNQTLRALKNRLRKATAQRAAVTVREAFGSMSGHLE